MQNAYINNQKAHYLSFSIAMIIIFILLFFGTASMALDELHDLDNDEIIYGGASGKYNDVKSIHTTYYGVSSDESATRQNDAHSPSETPPTKKLKLHDAIDLFSRIIAKEIIRRLPVWRNNDKQNLKQSSSSRQQHHEKEGDETKHHMIDIQRKRRVGAWCPPDSPNERSDYKNHDAEEVVELVDKAIVSCSGDKDINNDDDTSIDACQRNGIESNNIVNYDVQPGMVVYVFPQGKLGTKEKQDAFSSQLERVDLDTHHDKDDTTKIIDDDISQSDDTKIILAGTRCLHEMGQNYDNDEQVVQYTLLEREPVELGNIDVHRKDFAYQPVNFGIDTLSQGHALETTLKTTDKMIKTLPLSRTKQSSWRRNTGNDQQVSFRWFSWVSHISQMLHKSKTYSGTSDDDGMGLVHPDDIADSSNTHSYTYPDHQQSSYQSNIYEEEGKSPFAGGSHGEIWKARRRCPSSVGGVHPEDDFTSSCDDDKDLIVKRLKIEHGYQVLEAGLREVYFGELLAREAESSAIFTTYVDHFFREGLKGQVELWIVFENAGISLRSFLYTPVDTGGFVVFQHSSFWRRLRRGIAGGGGISAEEDENDEDVSVALFQPDQNQIPPHNTQDGARYENNTQNKFTKDSEGGALLREVLRQLITAVAFLNERGIVHRDIKPSNVMCKTTSTKRGRIKDTHCVVGDFSSAWDKFSGRNLYDKGPSSSEQTNEYAPPEVLFQWGSSWAPFFHKNPYSYDSWSIGVVVSD